ncbi:MAG: hypothetical protein M5R40_22475 [Anaerolineae bacterium]|nr:hypothetical protein [Anaerolineae bacterium]
MASTRFSRSAWSPLSGSASARRACSDAAFSLPRARWARAASRCVSASPSRSVTGASVFRAASALPAASWSVASRAR